MAQLSMRLSSGGYVRAVAEALGGHCVSLRRTHVGPFDVADADADADHPAGRGRSRPCPGTVTVTVTVRALRMRIARDLASWAMARAPSRSGPSTGSISATAA